MKNEEIDYACIKCLLEKNLNIEKLDIVESKKTLYFKELLKIIADAPISFSAPEIVEQIKALQEKYNIKAFDYSKIKQHYNALLMSLEDEIFEKICNSEDGLYNAVCYALVGNYIDFGTNLDITEEKLKQFIDGADNIEFNKTEFYNFKDELSSAKRLVYLCDNCGEIVFDKLFIKYLKKEYSQLKIDVIVRGKDVLNDATMVDAKQIGLDEIVNVTHNGIGVAGTVLERITNESLSLINNADIIISKGMGNFETLKNCDKNIYYLFMCKCEKFCKAFNSPLFTYMFINDKRIDV